MLNLKWLRAAAPAYDAPMEADPSPLGSSSLEALIYLRRASELLEQQPHLRRVQLYVDRAIAELSSTGDRIIRAKH
jgi:hypothetical protein